jgi:OmcA/MtrC family decaheme c-type cytochrome
MTPPASFLLHRPVVTAALLLGTLVVGACHSGNSAPPAPAPIGISPDPVVSGTDALPGVVVTITKVTGGSGPGGNFHVGDVPVVDFTVKRTDGVALELTGMARGAIMVSGPTFNYQRVVAAQSDLLARAVKTGLGVYSYTFAAEIPATYLAPLNDTTALSAGELTGEPLLAGTYTVGIEMRKDYVIDGTTYPDAGNATADFLFGDATAIEHRDLVSQAACNQCHAKLSVHGGNRNNVRNCVLCHTSGAEDRNVAAAAGGTTGTTIDFRVMIHKIHSGKHLPSVLGVTTNADGTRKYDATPQPYALVGYNDTVVDFSDVNFPAWPSFFTPMPRDVGFTALTAPQQSLENTMRSAPVDCAKCHGDPDGSGPLTAPAQSDLIYSQPTRRACGACHDDVVWDRPYVSNWQTMPPQPDDSNCRVCHNPADLRAAHTHPLVNPALAAGVHFDITSVTDVGNGNGRFEAGEKVRITFSVKNDAGDPIAASGLSRIEAVLNGPTINPQMIDYQRLPMAAFTGNGPYTFNLPALVFLEPIGTSTAALDTFATAQAPHWNVTTGAQTAPTTLLRRTGTGASTTLAITAAPTQNYIDVVSATGFANTNYVVIDDTVAGTREYMRVQWVDGNRLWFGSQSRQDYKPTLLRAHAIGAAVQLVNTAAVPVASYTLDATAGVITETTEFGAGEILANYMTDFVIPTLYPGALNDSPGVDQSMGDWTGLPLLDGTYTLDLHGARTFTVSVALENTSYTEGAQQALEHLQFGAATEEVLVNRINGADTCYACHNDIQFHGGSRRGALTCLMCHGTAGMEDGPQYVNHTAAATPGATVEFRNMLHEVHHVGTFPAAGLTANCKKCHGDSNTAWVTPADRTHPAQTVPTRSWRVACGSCHNEPAPIAHMDANTSPSGYEACAICHTDNRIEPVKRVHLVR